MRSSQPTHRFAPILVLLALSLAAPAAADTPGASTEPAEPAPASTIADAAVADRADAIAELESAISAEQARLLSLISQASARDANGFREMKALRESANRLPALQRELAALRKTGPGAWRSAAE